MVAVGLTAAEVVEATVEDARDGDALVEDARVEDALVEEAMVEDALVEDTMVEDALVEDGLMLEELEETQVLYLLVKLPSRTSFIQELYVLQLSTFFLFTWASHSMIPPKIEE
jgi:hypothetical protein